MVDEIDQRILGVLTDSGREMTVSEVMDELMAIYGEPYRRCRIRNRLQTLVKFRYCTSREATESIRGKPTRFYGIWRRERMTCTHYKETLTALRGVRLSTRSCAMGILSSNLPEHCEHCPMRTENAYVRCPICDRTFPSGVDMSYDGDWAMCKDCAKRLKGERMTELKPCPFCGCEMSIAIRDYTGVKLQCYLIVHPENGCILEDYESPEDSAIGILADMWNKRVIV